VKHIIFGKTQQRARYELEKIYDSLDKDLIMKYVKNPSSSYIRLKNDDLYETRGASDSARGCKCDKAFVDLTIDKDIIHKIIIPCLCASKLPDSEQIEYY